MVFNTQWSSPVADTGDNTPVKRLRRFRSHLDPAMNRGANDIQSDVKQLLISKRQQPTGNNEATHDPDSRTGKADACRGDDVRT